MAKRPSQRAAPETCPVCGDDVPRGALACPECGADHDSGWREDVVTSELGLADDEFDYDAFVQEEFGTAVKPRGIKPIWWVTAIVLILLTVVLFLLSLR